MPDGMLGRWAPLYEGVTNRRPYGAYSPTYQAAAEWLRPCATVEDWGGGTGYFSLFLQPGTVYRCVDGTANEFADEVADLTSYRPVTKPEGILCRHVLEHNVEWRAILANLIESFTRRAVVVVYSPFTPLGAPTTDLEDDESGLGVPTLSFNSEEFMAAIEPVFHRYHTFHGPTCGHYHIETVFELERR